MATKEEKQKLDEGAANIRKLEAGKKKTGAPASDGKKINGMTLHPAASVFPLLPPKEFKDLRADIEANGIKFPILVTKGKKVIIDGRNRYLIAMELGLKGPKQVPMEEFDGGEDEIQGEILSRNIFRRHLTPDQRVTLMAKVLAPQLEKEAAERKAKKGTFGKEVTGSVAAHLGKKAQVSQHKAEQALKAVHAEHADVADEVIAGKKSLRKATSGMKKKTRKSKAVPLEDRVWKAYSKLLNQFRFEDEREVKRILRSFLDNKKSK